MLDAAHGEGVHPVAVVQGVHETRVEPHEPRVAVACVVGRRRPHTALRADARQGSRRNVTEARSKHVKQSLG